MTTQWQLDGTYFEACTCKGACPCLFAREPTEGTCDAVVGWHVDRGHYGDVELDGLNTAMALHAPGNMAAGDWTVVLYLDDDATDAQRDALERIFRGEAGGHPAMIASLFREVRAVESVPIRYEAADRRLGMRVGEAADASLEAIEGQGGGEARISGHPVAISPGHDLVAAASDTVYHRGHGLDWDAGGRVAAYAQFHYEAA